MKIVTTSWDDGYKESNLMAELLNQYHLQGTFYVPVSAVREGRIEKASPDDEFLSENELKEISKDFEIGPHGISHRFLTDIPNKKAEEEIRKSKEELEKIAGTEIYGFAYPAGKYNTEIMRMVKEAGYSYARTIANGRLKFSDRFKVPVTIFCYNNWIRRLKFSLLSPFSRVYSFGGDWVESVLKAFRNMREGGGVLHIAEHPNRLRNAEFRQNIEKVFSQISGHPDVEYLTNKETVDKVLGKIKE